MVIMGVILHAIGGFAAGSFYLPLKCIRNWSWETAWIINGLFSWILAPLVVAILTVSDLWEIFSFVSKAVLGWTFLFGLLWGIGGLSFGLSVRYLGMSLGYGLALGFCAAFGTLIPAIHDGRIATLMTTFSGWVVLSGIGLCLLGIALCGIAGQLKERSAIAAQTNQQEFQLGRGLLVAGFAGLMSACMAFGFSAGSPIADAARLVGTHPLWVNNAVLVVILLGGFVTNALWCIYLMIARGSWSDFLNTETPRSKNFSFAAIAGATWYLQFMFYGMGSTKMGDYEFTSWTLHMSFIIIASNLWSLYLKEWSGAGKRTITWLIAGILVIGLSTLLIGLGNYLQGAAAAH